MYGSVSAFTLRTRRTTWSHRSLAMFSLPAHTTASPSHCSLSPSCTRTHLVSCEVVFSRAVVFISEYCNNCHGAFLDNTVSIIFFSYLDPNYLNKLFYFSACTNHIADDHSIIQFHVVIGDKKIDIHLDLDAKKILSFC